MRIALIGDVGLFGCNNIHNPRIKEKFKPIKDLLSQYDYVIGNLETPLTTSSKTIGGKSAYIKGEPKDVEILKYIGITHVSLANNHILDYKKEGLTETINALDKARIGWFGVNKKSAEIIDDDTRIRIHGYCCYSTNGKGLGNVVNELNPLIVERDINKDYCDGFLPILSCHWGEEHVHYPNYDHLKIARKVAKCGNCIVHGHHPHVIQGIEELEGSLITYSLGNFCFDDVYTNKSNQPLIRLKEDNRESFVLEIEIINNSIRQHDVIPFIFDKSKYYFKQNVCEKILKWSSFLANPYEVYNKTRQKDLNAYISSRKKTRDVHWYIKRLNMESLRIIISNRRNRIRYKKIVKKYVVE